VYYESFLFAAFTPFNDPMVPSECKFLLGIGSQDLVEEVGKSVDLSSPVVELVSGMRET